MAQKVEDSFVPPSKLKEVRKGKVPPEFADSDDEDELALSVYEHNYVVKYVKPTLGR